MKTRRNQKPAPTTDDNKFFFFFFFFFLNAAADALSQDHTARDPGRPQRREERISTIRIRTKPFC